jgi:hypothetical protein
MRERGTLLSVPPLHRRMSFFPQRLTDRFYEGVYQARLNSDVQWFNGVPPSDTVVVTSLSMIRLQVLACR